MSAIVFGVPIEGISLEKTLERIRASSTCQWVVTANPENLLVAKREASYAQTLQQADIRLVDGFGLWVCLRLTGVRTERVTGVALSEALLDEAQKQGWRVGLFGAKPGIAERAVQNLVATGKYDRVRFHVEAGGKVSSEGIDDERGEEAVHRMTLFDPQILLVALSFPGQERWILRHVDAFPSLRAVVGVGGTFDFWSNNLRRAPAWMRSIGLEWLWRLGQEPHRIGRILRAVMVFPCAFFFARTRRAIL